MDLASLEVEVFLLGIWKSIEELEENLSLEELGLILDKQRERDKDRQRFMAAIQGIDLNEGASDSKDRMEEVKRRADMRLSGLSATDYANKELMDLGISVEEEE